jgi:hypothetical protein
MRACSRVRCNIKWEGPDHYWPGLGWCYHLRITCYIRGQKGSTSEAQIPIPGLCYETKRGQGGR